MGPESLPINSETPGGIRPLYVGQHNLAILDQRSAGQDFEQASSQEAGHAIPEMRTLVWALIVASTFSSLFIYALDTTIVADLVPRIVEDFQSASKLPWLSVGFSLGGVALAMPFGSFYAHFDAKWLYIGSTILFMGASALCGAALNMDVEIVGRVLAGAGGNGMYLGVLTLLSVNTGDKRRPIYLGLTGIIWGLGTVLGPVVGGGFGFINWRWAFYFNPLLGAFCLPAYVFLIPSCRPVTDMTKQQRLRVLNWLGMIISAGGFTTLIIGVSFGGTNYAWTDTREICILVISAVLWTMFFVQQAYAIGTTTTGRIFPVHFLLQKELVLLFVAMAAASAASLIGIFYIPLYFQLARGDTGMESAIRLLPYLCFLSVGILSNGALVSRFGHYKPWYMAGSTMALIGGILLSRLKIDTDTAVIYGLEVIVATGIGFYAQSGYAVIQVLVDTDDMANARTFMMIAQLSGIGVGLAIAGAIFLEDAQKRLGSLNLGATRSELQQLITGASSHFLMNLSGPTRTAVLVSILESLQKVFIILYCSAAVSLICGLLMKNQSMYKRENR